MNSHTFAIACLHLWCPLNKKYRMWGHNVQQKMLSEEWNYTVNGPCSKSTSPEMSQCICLCHFVYLFSQCHLWFVAVSPSFCQSVFLHPFFLLPLRLHPSFCTLGFCSPIVFQKKGKSCVGKGSICLISSSKMMEWVNPWACCPPALDPPLHHKSQETKLGFLS